MTLNPLNTLKSLKKTYNNHLNNHNMKKTLCILASMALMASCQQGEILVDTTETPEAPRRIGFETFVNKSTRAKGTNSTSLQDFYPTFNVYGWKTVGTETTCVFENIPVEYFAADEAGEVVYTAGKPGDEWNFAEGWYYENVRYWDQMATKYQFSAYTPAATDGTIDCHPDGLITIGSKNFPVTVDSENLMATPSKKLAFTGFNLDYMTAQSAVAASPVALNFKHLQAKFNVRIRLDNAIKTAQDVSVQKIQIHNLAEKGYYTNAATAPADAVDGWSTCGKSESYIPSVTTAYSLNAAQSYHDHYVLEQLIIPQVIDRPASYKGPSIKEFDEACIYVEYTIGTETFKSFTSLASLFAKTADSYTFKAGNQYTINITVGPKPIYFTTSVSAWAEEIEGNQNLN